MKLEAITAEDMAGMVEELLSIKYRDPGTPETLEKLLGGRESKVIAMIVDSDEAVVIQLWADRFSVTTGVPPRSDLRISIPLDDLRGLLMGRAPIRSFLRGKIRFWGSPATGMHLRRLFHIEIGDPQTAAGFMRHYSSLDD